MPRGGKRKGAGRKTSWASGCHFKDTKLIRVPVVIADQVLDYAHRLDAEDISNELVTKSNNKRVSTKVDDSKTKTDSEFISQSVKSESLPFSSVFRVKPLTQSLLIRRLGAKTKEFQKMAKSDHRLFGSWTSKHDPNDIIWEYMPKSKKYVPLQSSLTDIQASNLVKWQKKNKV